MIILFIFSHVNYNFFKYKFYLINFSCISLLCIIEQVHEISNNMACATSKASDQPAHTRSLIRAFASCLSILLLLSD